jgi:hypothetical protein
MPRPKSNKKSDDFRRIVHGHLRHMSHAPTAPTGAHMDEDALSVFVEGRLSDSEAAPIIKHLVSCASCRRITAQLIRLYTEIATEAPPTRVVSEGPGRIRRLLADLAARVLPSSGQDAVFAYHAPADDFEKKVEVEEKEENEGTDRNGNSLD